jgi:hypothetical protein
MKGIYDFGGECAQQYENTCKCGKLIEVSTRKDNCPEYRTDVYVRCECGESVEFILPVN